MQTTVQSFLKPILVAASIAAAPMSAHALSVTPLSITDRSQGTGTYTADLTGTTLTITWSGTDDTPDNNSARFFVPFTVSEDFFLTLTGYTGSDNRRSSVNLIPGEVSSGNPGTRTRIRAEDIGLRIEGPQTAGTYTLRFAESNRPDSGSATFEISPVPLPAAMALMLAALGGLTLLRRRGA